MVKSATYYLQCYKTRKRINKEAKFDRFQQGFPGSGVHGLAASLFQLGAVIPSRAVAEAFASQGYFFSSTGGSPLSCALGMTVLDVLRDEALQDNARHVGGHLKTRLEALRDRGEVLHLRVLGLARIAGDVTVDLAQATIGSISVLGTLQASKELKAALADRIT